MCFLRSHANMGKLKAVVILVIVITTVAAVCLLFVRLEVV